MRRLPMSTEGDKLEQVYEELVEKFPGYLGAHVAYLNALESPSDAKKYELYYYHHHTTLLFLSFRPSTLTFLTCSFIEQ